MAPVPAQHGRPRPNGACEYRYTWVIIAREYNEDPVSETMLPATWGSARRRTILLFYDTGTRVERLAVARYDIGRFFKTAWDKEQEPDQWKKLASIIEERDPERIAVNYSRDFALADGITKTQYEAFRDALSPALRKRIVSGEELAIGWLETRTDPEMQVYPQICRIAHRIIAQGFSDAVIQPGITTDDVAWWYGERIRALHLTAWFHPSVSLQRAKNNDTASRENFSQRVPQNVILPGDLLHVDSGIRYLDLNIDTQQHAYVLKPSIYTHPIGFHGHAAGPTIGLWDQQEGVRLPAVCKYRFFH